MEGELLSIETWRRFTYQGAAGVRVDMELKRMNPLEAAPLRRCLARARKAAMEVLPPAEAARAQRELGQPSPEQMAAMSQQDVLERLDTSRRMLHSAVEAQSAYFEAIPEDILRSIFARAVRNVNVIVDGQEVHDGPGLLAVSDPELLQFVINNLEALCILSPLEKKGSASPSTSDLPVTSGGASPATSIGSDGETSSTVTETRNES